MSCLTVQGRWNCGISSSEGSMSVLITYTFVPGEAGVMSVMIKSGDIPTVFRNASAASGRFCGRTQITSPGEYLSQVSSI